MNHSKYNPLATHLYIMCLDGVRGKKGCMHFLLFVNESIFHFTQGHSVLQTISISSTNTGENLPGNFIAFDSVPDRVGDGSALGVRYLCSRPCRLAVEVVVSTLKETNVVVFRRK